MRVPAGHKMARRLTKHRSPGLGTGSQPGHNRSQRVTTGHNVPQNTGLQRCDHVTTGHNGSHSLTNHRPPGLGIGSQPVTRGHNVPQNTGPRHGDHVTTGHKVPQNTGPQALGPGHNRVTTGHTSQERSLKDEKDGVSFLFLNHSVWQL